MGTVGTVLKNGDILFVSVARLGNSTSSSFDPSGSFGPWPSKGTVGNKFTTSVITPFSSGNHGLRGVTPQVANQTVTPR
jgi:hypothetical protein